jgi:ribose 5-phosphate isomerase A
MDQQTMKAMAGKAIVETLVKDGMKLGLGTGSTAIYVIRHIGSLLEAGILKDIRAVPTSFQTIIECEKWGIPLFTLNSKEIDGALDVTIDGADEVDPGNNCIKGGGGALLVEKVVASASARYGIVVDETKLVDILGMQFPVPLEVIPEARLMVTKKLETLGIEVQLREAVRKAGPVITEHGNMLLDIRFKTIIDPCVMEDALNHIPGVVENGFFTKLSPTVFIGHTNGTVEVRKP